MGLNFSPINNKRVRTNVGVTSNRTHTGHKLASGRKPSSRKLEAEPKTVADVLGDVQMKKEQIRKRRSTVIARQRILQDKGVAQVITTGKRRRQRSRQDDPRNYFGSPHRHSRSTPQLNSLRSALDDEGERVWRRPAPSLQAPLRSVLMDSSINTFPSHDSHAKFKRSVKRTNYQHPSCEC